MKTKATLRNMQMARTVETAQTGNGETGNDEREECARKSNVKRHPLAASIRRLIAKQGHLRRETTTVYVHVSRETRERSRRVDRALQVVSSKVDVREGGMS